MHPQLLEQFSLRKIHMTWWKCSLKAVTCYPVHCNVCNSALFIRQDHFMPSQVPLYPHYSVVRCCFHPVYIVLCCVVNINNNQTRRVTHNTYMFNNLSDICQLNVPVKCCQTEGECFLWFLSFLLTCRYFCKMEKRKYNQPFV